jgi:general secretion pathway protein F
MYIVHAQNQDGTHIKILAEDSVHKRLVNDLALQKMTVVSIKKANVWQEYIYKIKEFYIKHSAVDIKQQRFFSAEMATLLKAGIPIHEVLLKILLHSFSPKLSHAIYAAYQKLLQGCHIEKAFEGYPKIFTPVFRGFLKQAILTGNLKQAFTQFSEYCEYRIRNKREVSSNVLPLIFSAALAWVVTYVVQNQVLLIITEEAMILGKKLSFWGDAFNFLAPWVLSWKVMLPIVLIPSFFSRFLKSSLVVSIPILNRRVSLMAKLQFLKVMTIGLKAGMNFQSCFKVAQAVVDNAFYYKHVSSALKLLSQGASRMRVLKESALFSPLHCSLVAHTYTHEGMIQNLDVIIDFLESELRLWDSITGQAKKYSVLVVIVLYLLLTGLAVLYGLLGWQ